MPYIEFEFKLLMGRKMMTILRTKTSSHRSRSYQKGRVQDPIPWMPVAPSGRAWRCVQTSRHPLLGTNSGLTSRAYEDYEFHGAAVGVLNVTCIAKHFQYISVNSELGQILTLCQQDRRQTSSISPHTHE